MQWLLHPLYAPTPALATSLALLCVVAGLAWWGRGRRIALAIGILLACRYMLWRALYTLNLESGVGFGISLTLLLAESYGFVQLLLFSYQVWSTTDRRPPPLERHPRVDMLVPVVDEPLYVLERTLLGCLAQDYPEDRLEIHVLDDGPREEVRALAAELGVSYHSRPDRAHAKAGNLNHGLQQGSGELVAVLDVDHVPVPGFLRSTVGFFDDPKVAIVQTPQGFYNPDIFQRSVGPRRGLHNEQELFFRTVQAGRDRHDSAFFAGSSGLLRRSALLEVGGFQTDTITEDIHTSLVLHARGWQSRYLNEPLAFGLMPESFAGYLRQRARWAAGTAQLLVRQNPLFTRGLRWPQRIDYFGSIYYFFFGLPRIVFLAAPLSWLLLSIPAVRADALTLVHFFLSAWLASAIGMRLVSRDTRNAFWSDVYETAMCFAIARASAAGLTSAGRSRPFEVTPKGAQSEAQGFASPATVGGHFALLALLLLGMANGLRQWLGASPVPGLALSLGWSCYNALLLASAIAIARERRQRRGFVRRPQRLPCQIVVAGSASDAQLLDASESGAELRLGTPLYALEKQVHIVLRNEDQLLTLRGEVVRQELEEDGGARVGVRFDDEGENAIRALITRSFAAPEASQAVAGHGALGSLWSLASVVGRVFEPLRPSRRRTPRLAFERPCQLRLDRTNVRGMTRDVSFAGVSALFPGRHGRLSGPGVLSIEDVELTVRPIECRERGDETLVRFRVEAITRGRTTWESWHGSVS